MGCSWRFHDAGSKEGCSTQCDDFREIEGEPAGLAVIDPLEATVEAATGFDHRAPRVPREKLANPAIDEGGPDTAADLARGGLGVEERGVKVKALQGLCGQRISQDRVGVSGLAGPCPQGHQQRLLDGPMRR